MSNLSIAQMAEFALASGLLLSLLVLVGMPSVVATVITLAVMAISAHQLGWRGTVWSTLSLAGFFIVLATFFLAMGYPVLAQASSSVPPDTTVAVPVGSWLQASMTVIVDILGVVIGGLLSVILAKVPATLRTYITAGMIAQVDQLLGRAVQFALQKAADAIGADRKLTVDVKSAVVADAVQYAIDHGPDKLITMMGGAQGIEEKIIARLPLPKEAPPAPAEAPTTTAPAAG